MKDPQLVPIMLRDAPSTVPAFTCWRIHWKYAFPSSIYHLNALPHRMFEAEKSGFQMQHELPNLRRNPTWLNRASRHKLPLIKPDKFKTRLRLSEGSDVAHCTISHSIYIKVTRFLGFADSDPASLIWRVTCPKTRKHLASWQHPTCYTHTYIHSSPSL